MRTFWVVAGVSLLAAAVTSITQSAAATGLAVAGALATHWFFTARPVTGQRSSTDRAVHRGWHVAQDATAVERWHDGNDWTLFERPKQAQPRRTFAVPGAAPAGWKPDPSAPTQARRWWNGKSWTPHRRPMYATFLSAPGSIARARTVAAVAVVLIVLIGDAVVGHSRAYADRTAVVTRVVDGDTVDVRVNGRVERVRLLNIDTPETIDPSRPVECLGPESTDFTRSVLSPGDTVTLKFDGEKTDGYGRTLAAVFLQDGSNVSTLLAAEGLGSPVDFGHRRFAADAQQAGRHARAAGRGIYNVAIECTAPGTLKRIRRDAVSSLVVAKASASLGELKGAAHRATALIARTRRFSPTHSSIWNLYPADYRRTMRTAVREVTDLAQAIADRPVARIAEIDAKRAAAEAVAAKNAAEERRARAATGQSPERAGERSRSAGSSGGRGGSVSAYTGCRRYAPGGKTWKPIACP